MEIYLFNKINILGDVTIEYIITYRKSA